LGPLISKNDFNKGDASMYKGENTLHCNSCFSFRDAFKNVFFELEV
jgi:hypothetical protein